MKITVLGCGSSSGVPLIGNKWGACDPANPRNRRLRASILVEEGGTVLLVDTSPDMRQQLLNCDLQRLDAVLYTHAHADHCHGIDDLRSINWLIKKPVDIYADAPTFQILETSFPYVFRTKADDPFYMPAVVKNIIEKPFAIGGIKIVPFKQGHGPVHSLGFRFNDFAYSTDVNKLDDAAFKVLDGVKIWIVDCIREEPRHHTHSHLAQTLEWIAKVRPERAFLTHMSHSLDYAALAAKLPKGVEPGYDGLVIEC